MTPEKWALPSGTVGIDMLSLGIPEEQEMARALESFNQAVESSKEIARYLNACVIASSD
jgi:hypothetical protein